MFETVHKVFEIVYTAMSSFIYQHKAQFLLINTTRQRGNSSSQYKAKKEDEMSSNELNLSDILLQDIEKPIPLCIVKEKGYSFNSFVRGYHAYIDSWDTKVGDENLDLVLEEDNEHDDFAITIKFEDRIVGHVPKNLIKIMNRFTKIPSCSLRCKVTGKRVNRGAGYGLEIPVVYELIGSEKAVDWGGNIKKILDVVNRKVKKIYKMILENILDNVRFTSRFFRGNLHLAQEKSVHFSTVRFMTCPLYRDFSMRI